MASIGSLPPKLYAFGKIPKFWKPKKDKISNFRMFRFEQLYRLYAFVKLSCRLAIVFCNPFSRLFLNRLIYDIWVEAKKMLMNEETQFNNEIFQPTDEENEEVRYLRISFINSSLASTIFGIDKTSAS